MTGATSGLGLRLCRKLAQRGYGVRAIVNPRHQGPDIASALPKAVMQYRADLTLPGSGDERALREACDGAALVFHAAGATFNHRFTRDQFMDINVHGTENLMRALAESSAASGREARLVYTSSVTVYGYKRPGEVITEGSKTDPRSDYSKSKLMAEGVVKSYSVRYSRLCYTILRLGTIYGPGYESSFFKVFRMIKEGRMRYVGKPTNHLTLVHVDDAAGAEIAAAESAAARNRVYNMTDGQAHTERELFELAASRLGVEPPEKAVNPKIARAMGPITGVNSDELDFLASDRVVDASLISREVGFAASRRIDVEGEAMLKEFIGANKSVN